MLKLEPREAGQVIVPTPFAEWSEASIAELAGEVDRLIREGWRERASDLVDRQLLEGGLGLSAHECQVLRDAGERLKSRRVAGTHKSGKARRRK